VKHFFYRLALTVSAALPGCGPSTPTVGSPPDYSQRLPGRFEARDAEQLLQQTVAYPACVETQRAQGMTEGSATFLSLEVDAQGRAGQVRFTLTKQTSEDCAREIEAAIVAAVARLPRFRPAQEQGQAGVRRLPMSLHFPPPDAEPYGQAVPQVAATFPGGGPALREALGYTGEPLTAADSTNSVQVTFTVRPDGRVGEARVGTTQRGEKPGFWSALYALNRVRSLPAFQPATSAGQAQGQLTGVYVLGPGEEAARQLVLSGRMPVPAPLPPLPLELLPEFRRPGTQP